jgi:hypothetical protein
LTITFQAIDSSRGNADLLLTRGDVNEGTIPVHLVNGRLEARQQIYLPLALKGHGG